MTLLKTGTSYSNITVASPIEYICSNCSYRKTVLEELEDTNCPECGKELIRECTSGDRPSANDNHSSCEE